MKGEIKKEWLFSEQKSLMLMGKVSELLSPIDLFNSLTKALELIRKETKADNCELFLAEHEEGDLVLSICKGKHHRALMTMVRFERGIGYPGIVVKTKKPLISRNVQNDPRYLRKAVKESGIQSYVSVPLVDFGNGPEGAFLLSWRRNDISLEEIAKLLQRVVIPISNTLLAGLSKTRISLRTDLAPIKRENVGNWLQNLLQAIRTKAGAQGGVIFLLDSEKTKIIKTASVGSIPFVYDKIKISDCKYLTNHQGVIIKGPCINISSGCKKTPNEKNIFCCAPIYSNGNLYGRIILDYGKDLDEPLTKELISLIAMAQEAAFYIPSYCSETSVPAKAKGTAIPRIELRCLGGFEVFRNGQPVGRDAFVRSKALILLKILLLKEGRAISKDTLIEMLWPEVSYDTGANRLHGVVHALRSAIEPNFRERNWLFIKSEGDCYYFNLDSSHKVDFFDFSKLLNTVFKNLANLSEDKMISLLEQALALYNGDLFGTDGHLPSYEAIRENLRQLYFNAVERLVEIRKNRNEFAQIIYPIRRAIQIDPLRETLYQPLIDALIKLGRRGEAKEEYQRCVAILHEELGVKPLFETLQLSKHLSG